MNLQENPTSMSSVLDSLPSTVSQALSALAAPEPEADEPGPINTDKVKDAEATVQTLIDIFHSYRDEESRKHWEEMIIAVYRAYRGYKPLNAAPYKVNYVIREIFRQIETLKPQLSSVLLPETDLFKYVARHAGFEQQAEAATRIVHSQLRRQRIDIQLQQWLDDAVLYGTSSITYGWSKFRRFKRKITPLYADRTKPVWKRATDEILYQAPYVEYLNPLETYSHPEIEDSRESPAVFVRKIVTPADLKTLVRDGWLDKDAVMAALEDKGTTGAIRAIQQIRFEGQVYDPRLDMTSDGDEPQEMLICWSGGYEYVVLNEKHLLRCHMLPEGRTPIITLRNYPQSREFYGVPEPLVILDDQRLLNDFMSMYVDTVHFTLNPMWKVKKSATKNYALSTFKPGGRIEVENMDDVAPLEVSPTVMAIQEAGNFVLGNMQLTTGLTKEIAGTGSDAKTATMGVRLQQAAGARIQHKIKLFRPGFQDVFAELFNLNASYLDEAQSVRMEGPDGKAVFPSVGPDAFSDLDIDVQLADEMEHGPEMVGKALQMYQAIGADPLVNRQELIIDIARAAGKKNPKRILASSATDSKDALIENENWHALGVIEDTTPGDDHMTHLQIHKMFMATPIFAQKSPQQQENFQAHVACHLAYMQKLEAAQGQASQTPTGPGGPTPQAQQPSGSPVPEADARTEGMFGNGMRGAAQQGAMQHQPTRVA